MASLHVALPVYKLLVSSVFPYAVTIAVNINSVADRINMLDVCRPYYELSCYTSEKVRLLSFALSIGTEYCPAAHIRKNARKRR